MICLVPKLAPNRNRKGRSSITIKITSTSTSTKETGGKILFAACLASIGLLAASVCHAEQAVYPDKPNAIDFDKQSACYVRLVIQATNDGSQACIDELEIYGKDSTKNLAVVKGAKAAASSCIQGYSIHQIENLNDGEYGNGRSWIAAGTGEEWAQIALPEPAEVARVVFSRDRSGVFRDRVPVKFEIRLSMDGKEWKTVKAVSAAVKDAPGVIVVPDTPPAPEPLLISAQNDPLKAAFLGEEHAWLKTYGRADISPALVPYNGRVKEYPRHVGDDCLPLSVLAHEPKLDGSHLNWAGASCGAVRVASPYDVEQSPLVTFTLQAGRHGDSLFFSLHMDRLLSRYLAVISSGETGGVIEYAAAGLRFNTYSKVKDKVELASSVTVDGILNRDLTEFEFKLPMSLFPDCAEKGLRVGLGMGGKHTSPQGRPIDFIFAPLSIAASGSNGDLFTVDFASSAVCTLQTNLPGHESLTLEPGRESVIKIAAEHGPIGSQFDLKAKDETGHEYALHLFRYDPTEHTLDLFEEMIHRIEAKGIPVDQARGTLSNLRTRQAELMRNNVTDEAEERALSYEARMAKRALMFRDPDLKALDRILFVKRHAFRPSHNYSDYFDAPFRPGGGIYTLDLAWKNGTGLDAANGRLTRLFDAGAGIARNPAATFDAGKVYFGYRASEPGYYHIMRMNANGSDLKQITDGPFHDFWPCPLPGGPGTPGGDLAFISTRCKSRVFCWRPQASTLFRMNPNGDDIRPLSLANVTEWAPSMMNDGRILWTRWEYLDKGADFGHTLWSIRPDGRYPALVFGNDIIQPNGYANGREVPGTQEVVCTLISHFGDLNGPIALLDTGKGRSNPKAISSLTPEVPWPGAPPLEECFREPYPVSKDYFLVSHAPRGQFGIYVLDRYGNRELLYMDPETLNPEGLDCMCPTLFDARPEPPALTDAVAAHDETGEFILSDVYAGLEPTVARGTVKYLRVVEEVQHHLLPLANGEYRKDHEAFFNFYASPVDKVSGPFGWPAYVAKASLGLVPVAEDGSAHFRAPAGKVLYFEALDKDFNELQRMRSVIQLQPGEKRSCIGCHESRQAAPPMKARPLAQTARDIAAPSWGAAPFWFARVVQPVLDAKCVRCHNAEHPGKLDFRGDLDADKVPASYRTLITKGLVRYVDCGWNSGGCEKLAPMTFGSLKSKLWQTLNAGHHDVHLTSDEMLRIKTWTDLNCPLWGDYEDRDTRPGAEVSLGK